jgi:hypothetical protein
MNCARSGPRDVAPGRRPEGGTRLWPVFACLLLGTAIRGPSPAVAGDGGAFRVDHPGSARAAPLSTDTNTSLFALGRSRDFQPYGGEGVVEPGPPSFATVRFRDVPEGDHLVDFVGYAALTFAAPNPEAFPLSGHCVRDLADARVTVVSGGRNGVSMTATAEPAGCAHTAVDRVIARSDYRGDADHPWFGSATGENIVTLYLDDWGTGAKIDLDVDTGNARAPFGLFPVLPDTAAGALWPDPADWNVASLSLVADANGDALAYLVARPGAAAVLWETIATNTSLGASARVFVWVSGERPGAGGCSPPDCDDGIPCTIDICNPETNTCEWIADDAACDDGDLCTVDVCDPPAGGCTNSPRLDGTECAVGHVWDDGQCVPGMRLDPVDLLTGDCSNTGGGTTNFPQMRCGNSFFVGPFEVTHFPALTFDLSVLPPGATIQSAALHLLQEQVDGDGPYTGDLLEVVAEQVRFDVLFGCDQLVPIGGTIGQRVVSTSAELGWRTADISEAVLGEVALGRDNVQLRLQFVPSMTDGDGDDDLARFASDNALDACRQPFVLVRFEP